MNILIIILNINNDKLVLFIKSNILINIWIIIIIILIYN